MWDITRPTRGPEGEAASMDCRDFLASAANTIPLRRRRGGVTARRR
jgi:hypothetical protein